MRWTPTRLHLRGRRPPRPRSQQTITRRWPSYDVDPTVDRKVGIARSTFLNSDPSSLHRPQPQMTATEVDNVPNGKLKPHGGVPRTVPGMDPRFAFLLNTPPATSTRQGADTALPTRHVFQHGNREHGEVSVYYWPAQGAPEHVLLFWPGNPGIPDYYTEFLTNLHSQLPDTHAIISASHVGGDPGMPAPATPLVLADQVAAKVEFVDTLRASLNAWAAATSSPQPKFALSAHSIGTWMTVEVMKRAKDQVDAAYLLFPTLGWIGESYNGRMMWPVFRWPLRVIIPYLAYLAAFIAPYTALHHGSKALVSSYETLRHVLTLAADEMKMGAPDMPFFKAQGLLPDGEGVYSIWSAGTGDKWVGREGPMIQEALGKDRVFELKAPHAFVLWDEHVRSVADIMGRLIRGEPSVPQ